MSKLMKRFIFSEKNIFGHWSSIIYSITVALGTMNNNLETIPESTTYKKGAVYQMRSTKWFVFLLNF